jgi:hypothetical protein
LRKLQQFYIFKFDSNRLKASNFNITLTPWQARKNGELISLGDSQMLRSLRQITGKENYQDELQPLLQKKKNIKKSNNLNKLELYDIENKIDNILFVKEIISLNVKNVKHYEKIIKDGLFVNNKKYVRLMCGAGQARRNDMLLVDSEIEQKLKKILNNDRNDIDIIKAKFNAYFALASSTALDVSTPLFCVIPDCKIMRKEAVEWIEEQEDGDDLIEIKEKELEFNLFDGQGLISPRMAKQWAADLEIDYIPSCFIVRSNFIKGMVCVFDFLEYSDEIGIHLIKDIYGNIVNIRDMDIILTESQFKLWNAFENTRDYVDKCQKNKLKWEITRYSPKQEKAHTTLNYQFLQVLKLDNSQIKSLCKKTVEYFRNILSNNIDYTLLYLLGSQVEKGYDIDVFNKIQDNVTKALILNNNLIDDPYIQFHIQNSIQKKISESYIGKIIVDGQYSFMVGDPLALAEHVFGMKIVGALNRGEYYDIYWLDKNENKVACMRSPLTWDSEVVVLNLVKNDNTKKWYKYLNNCIIFNVHGADKMLLADGDFDGDACCITNQKEIIEGARGGLPIAYENKKAQKCKIIESELYLADIGGFNTKVGFLTNLSTTMRAMLPLFSENSKEYKEIIRRLKQCRKEQGSIIDSTKGLVIRPIPKHWTNRTKITEDMTNKEIEIANFNNSILIEKRPQFMIHLYPNYAKDYNQYCYDYDILAQAKFRMFLDDLLNYNLDELDIDKKEFIDQFYKYNPLLDTNCEMNNISKYMQNEIKNITEIAKNKTKINKNLIKIMKKKNIKNWDDSKTNALVELHKKYKSGKKSFGNIKNEDGTNRWQTIEQYNKFIRQEALLLSSNLGDLASQAISIYYNSDRTFVWNIFGKGIVDNIIENTFKNSKNKKKVFYIPFLDEDGDIEFLGKRYSRKEIKINNDEDIYDFL